MSPRRARRPTTAPALAVGVLAALLLASAGARAQLAPVLLGEPGGPLDLWVVRPGGDALPVAQGVELLPVGLAGVPVRDRLRQGLPVALGEGTSTPRVAVPGVGALYRVRLASGMTGLVLVGVNGRPRLLLRVADVGGVPALAERLFVGPGGAWVLVATSLPAGGDVLRVDLASGARDVLTSATPPLDVDDVSLRSSAHGTWFTADGELFRVDGAGAATAVRIPEDESPWALPELALDASGRFVAVVVTRSSAGNGVEDDVDKRTLWRVPVAGPPLEVGKGKGDYPTPCYDHPRGPFLSLSDDGSHAAFRRTENTQELFLRRLDPLDDETHITEAPTFYNYIDNVGVLGFLDERTLFFAAGDTLVSGQAADVMIGAGELYAGRLDPTGDPDMLNVSATSGLLTPPFEAPGTVHLLEATLSPSGAHLLTAAQALDGRAAGTHALDAVRYTDAVSGVTPLLDGLLDPPRLVAAGAHVLVESRRLDATAPGGVARDLHLLDEDGAAPALRLVATVPAGIAFDRFVVAPAGDRTALVARTAAGDEQLLVVDHASGVVTAVGPSTGLVSPGVGFSADGVLHFGFGATPAAFSFGWALDGATAGPSALPVAWGVPLPY